MKKYAMGFALFLVLLISCGCGEKKMTCKMTEEENGMKYEASWEISYKDDKILKATNKNIMEADKDVIESYKESIENSITDSLKDIKGLKINSKKSGDTKYTYEMSFDFKKLDYDALAKEFDSESLDISKDISLEKFKSNIEEQGYTCK